MSSHYQRSSNSSTSITTSVTIRVTPEQYNLWSWVILWFGFCLSIVLASYQVYREQKWMASRRRADIEQAGGGGGAGGVGSGGTTGEGELISIGDITRSLVRLSFFRFFVQI